MGYMNDIVLLFPQVWAHCWDNDGTISKEDFATNNAVQERALISMINHLTLDFDNTYDYTG